MWVGHRDEDNRLVIRDPNHISPQAKEYTSLAKGHPEGWNDAFKGNIYSFYRYLSQEGEKKAPDFATLEEAARIVQLTEAIVRSSREKRWITIEEEWKNE